MGILSVSGKTFAEILVCCKNALVDGNSQLFSERFESFIGLFWGLRILLFNLLRYFPHNTLLKAILIKRQKNLGSNMCEK